MASNSSSKMKLLLPVVLAIASLLWCFVLRPASAFIAVTEAAGSFQRGSLKVSAPSGALSPYTVTVTFDGAFDAKLGPPTVLCSAETASNDANYQVSERTSRLQRPE